MGYFQVADRLVFSTRDFAPIFKFLLIQLDSRTAWLALGVCALAAAWRRPRPILWLVDALGNRPASLSVAAAIGLSIGSLLVYHNHPFSMDEYAAVFQSKLLAAGRLWAQLPPHAVDWLVVRGFNGAFLYASAETGHAVEGYWPGFSLLLAPFQLSGIPWACNAVLAAAALYLTFKITLKMTDDRRAAGWALLFTLASGAFAAYAIAYYSMQSHLTCNLLFAWLLLQPTRARALAAGLVGSLAMNLHHAFPHALFAAPWLASMAFDREQRAKLGWVLLGYLPGVGVAVGWLMLRASILPAVPISATTAGVFQWPDAVLLNLRVASLIKLWLWTSPCLLILALEGARRGFADRRVRLLALSACATFLGYCFVRFDQGHGWGYRYFQSAWGCVPILAAVAMARDKSSDSEPYAAFAGAVAVMSLALIVPLQLRQISDTITYDVAQLPAPRRPGTNIFFLKPLGGFYLADLVQIDPLLRGSDLTLVTRGAPLDAQLLQQNWPQARKIASGPWGEQWWSAATARAGSGQADARLDGLHYEMADAKANR